MRTYLVEVAVVRELCDEESCFQTEEHFSPRLDWHCLVFLLGVLRSLL